MSFIQQKKELLLEEVEPRVFLDEIECLTSDEKERIKKTSNRRKRMKLILEKIKSSNKVDAARIAKCMKTAYPNLDEAFKQQEQSEYAPMI